jgi:hypothetical protein
VSEEENRLLVTDFIEGGSEKVIFQVEHNKSSGLDEFPAELCFLGCNKGRLDGYFS